MERATIIADGDVQGVGFRYSVREMSKPLNVTGYVKNLDDGTVEIVAEGTKPNIDLFIQNVRNAEKPARVDDVLVSHGKDTNEFKSFTIIPGDILHEMIEGFGTSRMYAGILDKKMDLQLEKQDQTISAIQDSSNKMLDKQDQMLDKQDQMLDKQDQTISAIQDHSTNIHDMMDSRFQRIEGDVRSIKEKIEI